MNVRYRGDSTDTGATLDAEGPLQRWARRKREVAREKQADEEVRRRPVADVPDDVREPVGDAPEPAADEQKVLTDEDMPSLDSLDEDSDYSGFLSSGVSEELRRRALRKLFSSAVFNIPDGLDDYDDDFTSFAALGDIVTSDMKHQAEMEAERAKRAQAQPEPAAGGEDDIRGAGDEPPAGASDDAPDLAEASSADPAEPRESQLPGGAEPAEPVTHHDPAERAQQARADAADDRRT